MTLTHQPTSLALVSQPSITLPTRPVEDPNTHECDEACWACADCGDCETVHASGDLTHCRVPDCPCTQLRADNDCEKCKGTGQIDVWCYATRGERETRCDECEGSGAGEAIPA